MSKFQIMGDHEIKISDATKLGSPMSIGEIISAISMNSHCSKLRIITGMDRCPIMHILDHRVFYVITDPLEIEIHEKKLSNSNIIMGSQRFIEVYRPATSNWSVSLVGTTPWGCFQKFTVVGASLGTEDGAACVDLSALKM